jgi:hypothetical protein
MQGEQVKCEGALSVIFSAGIGFTFVGCLAASCGDDDDGGGGVDSDDDG